ncbi:DUF2807 domain-containing protein [Flavicella sp.]|uniref:GIN domain-containing protein n=1 Tax=Flavicella sp. TaxID=2957742 RepID=UPI00301A88F4
MKQKIKKTLLFLIAIIALTSCASGFFSKTTKGNKIISTEERERPQAYTKIKVEKGITVYITISTEEKIQVEAEENLQKFIKTEMENGTLHVFSESNIKNYKPIKVYLSTKKITSISASSGAKVISENTLFGEHIIVKSSSGSLVDLQVGTNNLVSNSSSGSTIKLSGTTTNLTATSSSGSSIKAYNLKAKNVIARACSGSRIVLAATEKLNAKSSSAARIKYKGDSNNVQRNTSTVGGVNLVSNSSIDSIIKRSGTTTDITANSSSGSTIKLSGTTTNLTAISSSGSSIKAHNLKAKNVIARASSGSRIVLAATEKLNAKSSSAARIKYKGDLEQTQRKKSTVGGVNSFSRKIISGNVLSFSSKDTLAYVNIGISNKDIGTVSSDKGEFMLELKNAYLNDSLKFSMIGYNSKTIAIKDFVDLGTIMLQENISELDENVVRNKQDKLKILGNKKQKIFFGSVSSSSIEAGTEIGIKVTIKKPTIIETFNIVVVENENGILNLRINFYDLKNGIPNKRINKENIIIQAEVKDGLISVDLSEYDLIFKNDFFVSMESLSKLNEGKIIKFAGKIFKKSYYRETSQAKWNKMFIGFYIFLNVKQ